MKFTKMEGLGNDYLYFFGTVDDPAAISRKYSDRHFGVGSDGIILIGPSDTADFSMRIFNADGSEAKMCGNGIRCVGKYVYDKGYTDKTHLTVSTLSGIKILDLTVKDGKVAAATVDMGKVVVSDPVSLKACGQNVICTPVSVGNPHAVTFVEDAEHAPLTTVGTALEHHTFFPEGVNAEFVQVLEKNKVRMRVWERGSGITMACGTGACATAAACVQAGFCSLNEDIAVVLDGGTLTIRILENGHAMMTGPCNTVCECEVENV
ncbi:MAG: diaminopimelate epimerase [Clostridia bacterium]|nr:diaminopimelate epimerase [Clostridia bacterium]